MPTNDERREIAKRLRDLKQLGRHSTACLVCDALSIDDMCPKDCDPERRLLDVAHALADLIEPKLERTCHMADCHTYDTCVVNHELGNGNITSMEFGYKQCSECGAYVFDCPTVRYCPNCGAKVVEG